MSRFEYAYALDVIAKMFTLRYGHNLYIEGAAVLAHNEEFDQDYFRCAQHEAGLWSSYRRQAEEVLDSLGEIDPDFSFFKS